MKRGVCYLQKVNEDVNFTLVIRLKKAFYLRYGEIKITAVRCGAKL